MKLKVGDKVEWGKVEGVVVNADDDVKVLFGYPIDACVCFLPNGKLKDYYKESSLRLINDKGGPNESPSDDVQSVDPEQNR